MNRLRFLWYRLHRVLLEASDAFFCRFAPARSVSAAWAIEISPRPDINDQTSDGPAGVHVRLGPPWPTLHGLDFWFRICRGLKRERSVRTSDHSLPFPSLPTNDNLEADGLERGAK